MIPFKNNLKFSALAKSLNPSLFNIFDWKKLLSKATLILGVSLSFTVSDSSSSSVSGSSSL